MGATVGRFHDAGATPGADHQPLFGRAAGTVAGDQARKQTCLLVILGIAQLLRGGFNRFGIAGFHGGLLGEQRLIRRQEARAAKHHNRVFYALCLHLQLGLEHLQLDAQTACFAAQQKFGVGKSQSVGIGLQWHAGIGMGFEVGPGVCQGAITDILGGFHNVWVDKARLESVAAIKGAMRTALLGWKAMSWRMFIVFVIFIRIPQKRVARLHCGQSRSRKI